MLDAVLGRVGPRARFLGAAVCALTGCSGPSEPDEPSHEGVGRAQAALSFESIQNYAAECDRYTGVSVPDFDCEAGTEVPTTNAHGSGEALTCDRPNLLNSECDPASRFQVLVRTPDAYVVAHCRKRTVAAGNLPGDGKFADIAVIQHNDRNGATCFYQALDDHLSGKVTAPGKDSYPWLAPVSAASMECVHCHDNGPILRSPYLAQITGPNKLPGAGEFSFNRTGPYSFVGGDFATWRVFKVEIQGNTCNGCHRLGVSMANGHVNEGRGTAKVFARLATQQEPMTRQNPHSPSSPLWMTPGNAGVYSAANFAAATAIEACANQFSSWLPLPNSSACKITEYTTPLAPLRSQATASESGRIAVLSRIPAATDVFWIAADGSVKNSSKREGGNWATATIAPSGSAALGGRIAGVSRQPNTLEIFWIGPDGSVQDAFWYEGLFWMRFALAPPGSAATTGSLSAVARLPSTLDVFWIGVDGSLQGASWREGGFWSTSRLAPAGSASTRGGVSAISRLQGSVEVFYVGADGSLQDKNWYDGRGWNGFTLAPAQSASLAGSVAALSRAPKTMQIWYVGADGSIREYSWYEGVSVWAGFALAPAGSAQASAKLTAVTRRPESLELWYPASDGSIRAVAWREGSARSSATLAPAGAAGVSASIAAVSRTASTAEVFYESADRSLQARYGEDGAPWGNAQIAAAGSTP